MQHLRFFAVIFWLLIFQIQLASAETVLKCPEIYGDKSDLIRIDKNWFGKRTVENLITGQWQNIHVVKATDEYVLTSDGWGYENSKNCRSAVHNALDFCETSKKFLLNITQLPDGRRFLEYQRIYLSSCCAGGIEKSKGDYVNIGTRDYPDTMGICEVTQLAD